MSGIFARRFFVGAFYFESLYPGEGGLGCADGEVVDAHDANPFAQGARFGQHGGIQQSTTKEERDQGLKMPYVGNVKAFWGQGVNIVKEEGSQSAKAPAPAQADFNKDDDIPF